MSVCFVFIRQLHLNLSIYLHIHKNPVCMFIYDPSHLNKHRAVGKQSDYCRLTIDGNATIAECRHRFQHFCGLPGDSRFLWLTLSRIGAVKICKDCQQNTFPTLRRQLTIRMPIEARHHHFFSFCFDGAIYEAYCKMYLQLFQR